MRISLTGGTALPVALNQLLHPADQLLPHVVKQQVKDGLTAAPVRRDRRKTARPASRLGTVLLTLVVPDGNRKVIRRNLTKAQSEWIFLEAAQTDLQVSAVESQIFLHQTLHFDHCGLLLTEATAASMMPIQFCRDLLYQLRPPALHVQPCRQHSSTWT